MGSPSAPSDWASEWAAAQGAQPAATAPSSTGVQPSDWVAQWNQSRKGMVPFKPAPPDPMFGPWSSAFIRPIAKGAAALPLMAMDAGVAGRNLLERGYQKATGQPETPYYQLPSGMFNDALDSLTTQPQGIGKGAEFVSSTLAGSRMPMPSAGAGAPANFMRPGSVLRNQVLSEGGRAGYVVPPSSANPSFLNRFLEGIGGKIKLQQEAALRNQGVTDRLMTKSVGEPPNTPITQGALSTIRADAAQKGYGAVRQIGEIPTDGKYGAAMTAIEKSSSPGKLLSGVKPDTDVQDLVTSLRQSSFDSSDAVDTIQYLRQAADDAFGAGKAALGRAYKAASSAIEDQIERHLEGVQTGTGKQTLQDFRNARQLIAKTYTAGKGLTETGNFNARAVASQLARKKMMDVQGPQGTVARYAATFPKATQLTQESFPSISPLDAYGSAIAGAASHSLGPLAIPLTRVGIRQYLLSPQGQARALQAAVGKIRNPNVLVSALLQSPQAIRQSGLLNSPSTAP
jgi:hypothetical protein